MRPARCFRGGSPCWRSRTPPRVWPREDACPVQIENGLSALCLSIMLLSAGRFQGKALPIEQGRGIKPCRGFECGMKTSPSGNSNPLVGPGPDLVPSFQTFSLSKPWVLAFMKAKSNEGHSEKCECDSGAMHQAGDSKFWPHATRCNNKDLYWTNLSKETSLPLKVGTVVTLMLCPCSAAQLQEAPSFGSPPSPPPPKEQRRRLLLPPSSLPTSGPRLHQMPLVLLLLLCSLAAPCSPLLARLGPEGEAASHQQQAHAACT
jgi:hypothetical protein